MENRVCKDCGAAFIISEKENQYFTGKGLVLPKRCVICREYRVIEKMKAKEGRVQKSTAPLPGAPVRKRNAMNDPAYRYMYCVTAGAVEEPM